MSPNGATLDDALKVMRKHRRCRKATCKESVVEELRSNPEWAEAVMRTLVAEGEAHQRAWAAWMAPQVLPKARAIAALHAAVERERRYDQVDSALDELQDLDPEQLRRYLPRLRRRLAGSDWHSIVFVFWVVADLRDAESIPVIERTMKRALRADHPWIANAGSVICTIIKGDGDAILAAIRAHDHDRMRWLIEAARRMNTVDAKAALEACATSDADLECRMACRSALIRSRWGRDEVDYEEVRRLLRAEFGDAAVPDPPPTQIRFHDGRGLLRIAEVDDKGGWRTIYQRPPFIVRALRRLTGRH